MKLEQSDDLSFAKLKHFYFPKSKLLQFEEVNAKMTGHLISPSCIQAFILS